MPLLPPYKIFTQLRDNATEALFVISFGSYSCAEESQQEQESLFKRFCDIHNLDLVVVRLPVMNLPISSKCWQHHKVLIGNLITGDAIKDWARVCIVDESFQWEWGKSPFAMVPQGSIGVAFSDSLAGEQGSSPATMVVLSESHYVFFQGAVTELSAGTLFPRMQAMNPNQDRFLQFILQEADRLSAPVIHITQNTSCNKYTHLMQAPPRVVKSS
jgi:hypothetical protein